MLFVNEEKKEDRFWTGNIALFITALICLYLMMNSSELFAGIRYGSPVYNFCRLALSFSAGYGAAFCILDLCRGSLKRTMRGVGFLFVMEILYVLYRMFFGLRSAGAMSFVLLFTGSITAVLLIFRREHLII